MLFDEGMDGFDFLMSKMVKSKNFEEYVKSEQEKEAVLEALRKEQESLSDFLSDIYTKPENSEDS